MKTSNKLGLLVVIGAMALAPSAMAQPSATDLESARELYNQGKAMRDAGDVKGALSKLNAAHALGQTPLTGVELGKTQVLAGMLVEGRDTLLAVARLPARGVESARAKAARDEAQTLAEDLRVRIPSITVKIEGSASASVTVDGALVPEAALTTSRRLNPGKHEIVATAGARTARQTVELKEREQREVVLVLKDASPPAVSPPVASTPVASTPVASTPAATSPPAPSFTSAGIADKPTRGTNTLALVGFGFAGAGLVAGVVTGIMAMSKSSVIDAECVTGRCPTSARDDIDSGRTLGTISTIAFGVAGAGAIVGVIGLATSSSKRASGVAPWIGVGSAGVAGRF